MRLRYGAASHVGLVRQQNEDSYVVGGGIYAVCDGMGGARAGEVASELACAALVELSPFQAGQAELEEAVQRANTTVWRRGHEDPALAGMGTTMTVAISRGDALLVGHIGDSRAYRWRGGRLDQLTDDHSLVAEMVRQGQITPEQAEVHPHRSIITRALGTESVVEPDTFLVGLELGDRVLLCTDGLSGMVPAREIADALGADDDPQAIAESLVAAALAHGGEDNVTVVVMVAAEDDEESSARESRPVVGLADVLTDRPQVGPLERCAETGRGSGGALSLRRLRSLGARGSDDRAAPPGGEPARAARPLGSRRILMATGVAVALLVLVAVLLAGANSTVYFVGASSDGRVALFQGMPYAPLGVALYSVVEVSSTPLESLQPYLQERVKAEDLVSKEEGLLFVRGLEDAATSLGGGGGGPTPSPASTESTAAPTTATPTTTTPTTTSPTAAPPTTSPSG